MGVIASFLGTAFTSLFSFIAVTLGRKLSFSVAYIAVFVALVAVFLAAINALIGSISASAPTNSYLLAGLSLLPSNTTTCLSLISSAHTAAFIFKFKEKLLSFKVHS